MKKLLSLCFSLFLAMTAHALDTPIDSIYYTLNDDSVSVTLSICQNNKSGTAVIPDSVTIEGENYAVTAIQDWAFYECNVSSVSIPAGIKSIGVYAFGDCPSLAFFEVSEENPSFSTIDGVLYSKDKNTLLSYPSAKGTSYTIPDGVTTVGRGAFGYDSLITSVTIPESVTTLTKGAFYSCIKLASVNIPSGVKAIEQSVFYECESLTSLVIPEGVTSIGAYAFNSCTGLTTLTIPKGVTSISYGAFANCAKLVSMVIPSGVVTIEDELFYGCSGLISVSISDSVTSIGMDAFSGCSALTSIDLPDSLTTIGDYAFFECKGLTSIVIPPCVISIGETVFASCDALIQFGVADDNALFSTVDGVLFSKDKDTLLAYPNAKATTYEIPEGTTTIQRDAFLRSVSLTMVTFPASVSSMGDFAFCGCDALTQFVVADENTFFSTVDGVLYSKNKDTLVTYPNAKAKSYEIPAGTTAIGSGAFSEANTLVGVHIPSSVVWIGEGAFSYSKSLVSVNIPSGITSLPLAMFFGCTGLTEITIPSTVTSIGEIAFYGCSSLTSLDIQEGVSLIKSGAFYECTGLTSLAIPVSVDSIEVAAFYDCLALKEVHVIRTEPVTLNAYTFGNLDYDSCTLYVPMGSKAAYEAADVWNWFGNIVEEGVVSVKGTEALPFAVFVERGAVVVKGVSEGEPIYVFTVNGLLQKEVTATGDAQRITLPAGTVYFVKAGDQVVKIIL